MGFLAWQNNDSFQRALFQSDINVECCVNISATTLDSVIINIIFIDKVPDKIITFPDLVQAKNKN